MGMVPAVRTARAYLLGRDGLLARLGKLLNGLLVVAQVLFAADEKDGEALAEVKHLGNPLRRGRGGTCQSVTAFPSRQR